MASENELQIVLTAIDNASSEIQKVKSELNGVEKTTGEIKKTTAETGKTIKEQFSEASKDVREFRKTIFLAAAAMAAVISTVKEASKFSMEAKKTYDEFDISMKTLAVTIGQILAPAMEGITFVVKVLTDTIEAAVAGFIKLGTFIVEFFANIKEGPVEAYRRAMEISNAATDLFLNKIEATSARVRAGLTFDKEKQNVIDLEKITVKAGYLIKKSWDAVIDATGQLGASLAQASELGRDFAVAAAAVALGMAIVNTATGVTRAFKDYPWPFSMVVAGIIAAAGAIQIATIAATKFHEGGVIRAHSGLAVGEVPIIAQTGEGILSRRGMSALGGAGILNALNGGFGAGRQISVQNYIYNPVFRSDEDIDKLAEEISLRLAREAERI